LDDCILWYRAVFRGDVLSPFLLSLGRRWGKGKDGEAVFDIGIVQTFLTLIPSIKAPERLPTDQMVVFYVNPEANRLTPEHALQGREKMIMKWNLPKRVT